MENLLSILLLIFVIGLVLFLMKIAFKLTTKVISCGVFILLVVIVALLALGVVDLPAF